MAHTDQSDPVQCQELSLSSLEDPDRTSGSAKEPYIAQRTLDKVFQDTSAQYPVMSSASNTSAESPVATTVHTATPTSSSSVTTSASVQPRPSTPRFPVRIGITWKKGEKLEAMDFSRTWYPSKIVEIDETAKHVLIHFEGWNQRYDEWVAMDSDKLRPVTRHSERKDKSSRKRRIHPHPIYRPGEQVMAKWTDCKKYPAKVSRMVEGGMYEVIFYDGVSRLIQAMNIQPMPEEMKNMKFLSMKTPPSPKKKLSFKHIKVSLPESVRRKRELAMEKGKPTGFSSFMTRKRTSRERPSLAGDGDAAAGSSSSGGSGGSGNAEPKVKSERDPAIHTTSATKTKHSPYKVKPGKKSTAELTVKNETSTSTASAAQDVPVTGPNTDIATAPLTTETTSATVTISKVSSSSSSSSNAVPTAVPGAAAKKSVMIKSDMDQVADQTQVIIALPTTGTGEETPATAEVVQPAVVARVRGPRKRKRRSALGPATHGQQPKRRRMKIKQGTDMARVRRKPRPLGGPGSAERKSADAASSSVSTSHPPLAQLPLEPFVPSKAFIVEEDHNPFKCPHEGCNKDFRKENLLAYHIKYYHTEPETPPASTATLSAGTSSSNTSSTAVASTLTAAAAASTSADVAFGVTSPILAASTVQSPGGTPGSKKRRKKTNSVCSTDSDLSVSSKGKSSKRHRHDSEISVTTASPDLAGKDMWADVKAGRAASHEVEDAAAVDTEDEDMEADVVNCVCGQRETNGLMIQCDVCMCWQHFACVDTKNAGVPPANYVCSICENTPGVRDSCRFLHDMSWERRGELPSFPFVTENSSEHLKAIACECNTLISSIQHMRAALHSTRRQIKISKEETDPEFQLWQTDWDNWTKPEEDLTLTPCSADPEPSPTPSAFLFPSAPNPNLVTTTASNTAPSAMSPSASVSSMHSSSSSASLPTTTTVTSATANTPHLPPTTTFTPSGQNMSQMTTTIELAIASKSPSVTSQSSPALPDESSNNITPPSGSVPTTCLSPMNSGSTLRRPLQTSSFPFAGLTPNLQDGADSLVKDLFPGPDGDAKPNTSTNVKTAEDRNQDNYSSKVIDDENSRAITQDKVISSVNSLSTANENQRLSECSETTTTLSFFSPAVPSSFHCDGGKPADNDTLPDSQNQTVSNRDNQSQAPQVTSMNGLSKTLKSDQEPCDSSLSQLSPSGDMSLDQSPGDPQSSVRGEDITKPMTTLFVDVSGSQRRRDSYHGDDDSQDNDTDTAEESVDPYKNCEHNLLIHVMKVHADIDTQLEVLDQQISELENSEHTNPTVQLSEDNILNDVPALKKSLSKLARTLLKVQRFCVHH